MSTPPSPSPPGPAQKCPICNRRSDPARRPFCSRRCAEVDLARWLGGVYRIPGDDEATPPPADDEE